MTKLYAIPLSHPAIAARKMLERAGIEHEVVTIPSGLHPIVLRVRGFRGGTVPALLLDGRRVQGSLEIARAVADASPPGTIYPVDPDARARVEEAERWGEAELQPIPRRALRWALVNRTALRRWLMEVNRIPFPGVAGALMKPVARVFAGISNADDATVRRDLERLPGLLDRVDALIAEGTIGGEEPNAADWQIGTSVRAMMAIEDLRDAIEGRPAADLARRLVPGYRGRAPSVVPEAWRPAPYGE
ncbi:MAG: glutathione S-transferase N-terminal domain-containing protein [Gemmatimonadota bacterium]|nr:glutathione S-transferase N-terminal domain-containing protein [Gemmatimonadota bacterium]